MGSRRRLARAGRASGPARRDPGPFGPGGIFVAVARCEYEATREVLGEGRTPEKVVELAGNAAWWWDDRVRRLNQALPIACREGCSDCCHQPVSALVPEVIRIAAHMECSGDEAERTRTRDRIEGYHAAMGGKTHDEQVAARLPCPLLVEGRCSVHEVRPLACRGWNSTDVGACESYLTTTSVESHTVSAHGPQIGTAKAVMDGMRVGLRESGLDADHVDLAASLRIALDAPGGAEGVAARWLAGDGVFDGAKVDVSDAALARVGALMEAGFPRPKGSLPFLNRPPAPDAPG